MDLHVVFCEEDLAEVVKPYVDVATVWTQAQGQAGDDGKTYDAYLLMILSMRSLGRGFFVSWWLDIFSSTAGSKHL